MTGTRAHVSLAGALLVAGVMCLGGCGYDTTAKPASGVQTVRVTVTPSGCAPTPASVRAGIVDVLVSNLNAPTVSEVELRTNDLSRVLGERENLVQGLSASFSVHLSAGTYVVDCPGALQQRWSLVAVP